jgi:3-phosphoshikimate 1-carboxyvinyltransferase
MPGDKSISHRGAIMAALAMGRSTLRNYSTSEDCASTLEALRRLGAAVEREGSGVHIRGCAPQGFSAPGEALDCGNSGTTMRLLAGVLAGQSFASTLTGDDSLRARPMRRVIEPLELMGARVSSQSGRAPLCILGRRPLVPVRYRMPVASAQVKSCILLAGLGAEGRTTVIARGGPTRDHTERMLRWLGVTVETEHTQDDDEVSEALTIEGPATIEARDLSIPGDISSAVFFIAAAALLPGSELLIANVGLNPTRSLCLVMLSRLGAAIEISDAREECNEAVGTVRVQGVEGLGAQAPASGSWTLAGSLIPQLIDELPLLAVVGTQVKGGLTVRDAAELRVKESDRIAAIIWNLRAMGAPVEEYADGLAVAGPCRLRGAKLDAFGDHRIAMALSVAALLAEGVTTLEIKSGYGLSLECELKMLEAVVER